MIVLDASALLALINQESGWQSVARQAADSDATISAVNYAEVLQKAAGRGVAAEAVDADLDTLSIVVSPFSRLDARLAASFYRHRSGLSLADRVCLAPGPEPVESRSHDRSPMGRLVSRLRRRRKSHPLTMEDS